MMTLVIEGASGSRLAYQLDKPSVSVGASSSNDVVLTVPGVAPRHLVIQRSGDVFTFLGQQRQVVVLNGERRSRGVLRVGDKIRVGAATIVFEGGDDTESTLDVVDGEHDQAVDMVEPAPASEPLPRSEVLLFREPHRQTEVRRQLVDFFRSRMRSNLAAPLRALLAAIFPDRGAFLALIDAEGRFQPIVSQWEGDLPRLPVRAFEELEEEGRYAELRLAGRLLLLYPVSRESDLPNAYLCVASDDQNRGEDLEILGEFARLLAVSWDRVERSTVLYGEWASRAQEILETNLPGTSQAVRILRDSVGAAARSSSPVLLSGRPGSGRMYLANLIAALRPGGEAPLRVLKAQSDDEAALRVELFGPPKGGDGEGLAARAQGSVVVVRDVHGLSPGLQRELAAVVTEDLDSAYGPAIRWMVTTGEDATSLLNDGQLDVTLFKLFDRHVIPVPGLRERREDLPLLIVRLLERVGSEQGKTIRGIELETLNSMLEHSFDGEMKELIGELNRLVSATPDGEMVRGIVPRRAAAGGRATESAETVFSELAASDDLKQVIPAIERFVIDRVLHRVKGNQSKAARVLNLSRGALISKIKDYKIPDYRALRRNPASASEKG